jgi:DNA polymerase III delta subunit
MIYIFHGEGTGTSRKLLRDAIEKDKLAGHDIRTIEGDKLSPKDLESTLSTESLFSVETVVIENLLSRLRSKDKDACIELLSKYSGDKNILLWDKKEITKPNLTKLSKAKVSNSKAPTALFTLMDSLEPGNAKQALNLLHQTVKDTEDIIAFTMIARQISYLIMIKSGTAPKFAPWQIGKLKATAAKWQDKQLEQFLSELLKIDLSIKSGTSKLSYTDHLDLLLSTLLR